MKIPSKCYVEISLRFAQHYRHVGFQTEANCAMQREVKSRVGECLGGDLPIMRSVFRNECSARVVRVILAKALSLSRLRVGIAMWPPLNVKMQQSMSTRYVWIFRGAIDTVNNSEMHASSGEALRRADVPSFDLYMSDERLRLYLESPTYWTLDQSYLLM